MSEKQPWYLKIINVAADGTKTVTITDEETMQKKLEYYRARQDEIREKLAAIARERNHGNQKNSEG